MKQLQVLHGNGFDLEERREARTVIFGNLILAFERILKEMQKMKVCEVLWYLIIASNRLHLGIPRYVTLLQLGY